MDLNSEYAWALGGIRPHFRHTQPPAMLPSSIKEHFHGQRSGQRGPMALLFSRGNALHDGLLYAELRP